jgi:hypothetical protein
VCRFALQLRFVGATDTGSPERNLEAYRAQVCVSRVSQNRQIHGEGACIPRRKQAARKKVLLRKPRKVTAQYGAYVHINLGSPLPIPDGSSPTPHRAHFSSVKPPTRYDVTSGNRCIAARRSSVDRCV